MTVKAVQTMLRTAGFPPGPLDGDWGPLTQAAMDGYQRSKGVLVPNWLIVAERELGIHEIAGNKSEKRIIEYHSYTSLKATSDDVPWCSSFINFDMAQVGLQGTDSAAAASWLEWGVKVSALRYGAICVFARPGGNHVAIGLWQDVTHIACLGGNQSDKVCVTLMRRDALRGMRWNG